MMVIQPGYGCTEVSGLTSSSAVEAGWHPSPFMLPLFPIPSIPHTLLLSYNQLVGLEPESLGQTPDEWQYIPTQGPKAVNNTLSISYYRLTEKYESMLGPSRNYRVTNQVSRPALRPSQWFAPLHPLVARCCYSPVFLTGSEVFRSSS